jgi:hypothetical protein
MSTDSLTRSAPKGELEASLWARQFGITSIKIDSARWNKEWEKALHVITPSEVYEKMGLFYKKELWEPAKFIQNSQDVEEKAVTVQELVVKMWGDVEKLGHFKTAWLLLDEKERRRHLLNGMEEACESTLFGQDARALCPEITVTSMLQLQGRAFIDFIDMYAAGKRDTGVGSPYYLPSKWWDKAMENIPQSLASQLETSTFRLLTLHRNAFICERSTRPYTEEIVDAQLLSLALFLMFAAVSVMRDMSNGSPGMDPVIKLLKSDPMFASAWGYALSSMRDKPLIRCENCTKTPEEVGDNAKFMVCSGCKFKLDFTLHYCSQRVLFYAYPFLFSYDFRRACQKADWRNHKKHCGKEKVSKKLRGTIHDPQWAYPDIPAEILPKCNDRGYVALEDMGFATNTTTPQSPALQRQISFLNADRTADYFLFDESDQPVRVVIEDKMMKMLFRTLRATAWANGGREMEPIAQHLIKIMEQKPGLSRETILLQFGREYGGDATARVEEWERRGVGRVPDGETFLDMMRRNMADALPKVKPPRGAGPVW